MIYTKYPDPFFDNDSDLAAFKLSAAAKKDNSWTTLFDYARKHTARFDQTDLAPHKCYFSEAPLIGGRTKTMDHFRPKESGEPLKVSSFSTAQGSSLTIDFQDVTKGYAGYGWLKFDPYNFRLSHQDPNLAGGKGEYFPILFGTSRLTNGSSVNTAVNGIDEYPLLLDPCEPDDCGLFTVGIVDGLIRSIYDPQTSPTSWQSNPTEHYRSDWMNWVRAEVSIFVFKLNQTDFVRARKEVMRDNTKVFKRFLAGKDPEDFNCLLNSLSASSPFSLAARCAVLQYQLAPTASLPEMNELEDVKIKIVSELRGIEGPNSTFPPPY